MAKSKPKTVIRKMAAGALRIHPYAQRRIVEANLERLKKEMDLDALSVLHAVEYEIKGESATWVIDGQTRQRALVELDLGEWMVDVEIHLDVKDDARACALFLKLNKRASVRPYDTFKNEVKAGITEAVGIKRIVGARGLKIEPHAGKGMIVSIGSLKRIFRLDGGKSLSTALGAIVQAWGDRPAALEGKIIEGVSIAVSKYDGRIEIPSLITVLSKYSGGPGCLLGDARGITNLSKASLSNSVAQAIVSRYNHHRRSGKLDPL